MKAGNAMNVEIWPENWQAFSLFADMSTQWREGMNGPTGLDYTALMSLMNEMDLSRAERREMFDDIRVMERAALSEMQET